MQLTQCAWASSPINNTRRLSRQTAVLCIIRNALAERWARNFHFIYHLRIIRASRASAGKGAARCR